MTSIEITTHHLIQQCHRCIKLLRRKSAYVITDEFKVYKCLKTGGVSGSTVASTVKPTSVDTANPQVTGWYKGNSCIQLSLQMLSNLLNDFIPVKSIV